MKKEDFEKAADILDEIENIQDLIYKLDLIKSANDSGRSIKLFSPNITAYISLVCTRDFIESFIFGIKHNAASKLYDLKKELDAI